MLREICTSDCSGSYVVRDGDSDDDNFYVKKRGRYEDVQMSMRPHNKRPREQ